MLKRTVILAAALLSAGILCPAAQVETLEIGRAAPDFELMGVDGRVYRLADFGDAKVLVIVFTCNHCPTAQAYEQRIKKLAADYKGKNVKLVAISPNDPRAVRLDELGYTDLGDSLEDMKIRFRDKNFNFPYLYDGDEQAAARAYGPIATPHAFVFDEERVLRYQGGIDDSEKPNRVNKHYLRDAIEAVLSGREPQVQASRVFGCSVKWADKRAAAKASMRRWAAEPVSLATVDTAGIRTIAQNDTDRLRVISIWATWSGPGAENLRELVTVNRMYRKRDFELISICADSPKRRTEALAILKKQQASYTNYLFDGADIYSLMKAVDEELAGGVPYTLLIKPGGEIIYRQVGAIEPLELKKAVVEYLGRVYK